jgi:hypothetical protein
MKKWIVGCCGGCLILTLLMVVAGVLAVRWLDEAPRSWETEVSLEVAAEPAEVRALVEDLRRWPSWSAWARERAQGVERSYSGLERGVGAIYEWKATTDRTEQEVGAGRIEIRSAGPDSIEYLATHHGALCIASDSEVGGIETRSQVHLIEFDHEYLVPGSFRFEDTERGCRVTWRESVDLGDSLVAKFLGVVVLPVATQVHRATLERSLQGLKDAVELR